MLLRSTNATALRPNGWTRPAAEARFRTGACGCKCLGLASPDEMERGRIEREFGFFFFFYHFILLLFNLVGLPRRAVFPGDDRMLCDFEGG